MTTAIVYDGGEVRIPTQMLPEDASTILRKNQMQGTELERLCELAGRVCYDSLGNGRDSAAYHKHILEVGHTSVLAHANITFEIFDLSLNNHLALARLPGCYVNGHHCCINLRTIAEIDKYDWVPFRLRRHLRATGHHYAPQIIDNQGDGLPFELDDSDDPECQWISMYLSGSRGFSHEQVRHNYRCAISQRSTRYVDESESEWIWHPLFEMYATTDLKQAANQLQYNACMLYDATVTELQAKLLEANVDKFTARKQARGAARGFLGNALRTDMIFSASVAQWLRILQQRYTRHADAEIRLIYDKVLPQLLTSQYGYQFAHLGIKPCHDGMGSELA